MVWRNLWNNKKKKHLHISDALNRFLKNDNGPMESLRLDFLTTHGGTDTLEKIPIYLEHYTFNFPAWDIITGLLTTISQKGNKRDFPDYFEIKKYEKVAKQERMVFFNTAFCWGIVKLFSKDAFWLLCFIIFSWYFEKTFAKF